MIDPETAPRAGMPSDRAVPLALHLFGPFEVRLHGQPLPRLRSRKGEWLLALLTLRHGGEVDRSWLAGTLWPDSPETAALASLRSCLKDLRRALGAEAARLHAPTPRLLALDLAGAQADVIAFDAAMAQGEASSLEQAIALYRGRLHRELNAEPDPETQALYQQLRTEARGKAEVRGQAGTSRTALPAARGPADRPPAFRHNLPLQLTRFIGREDQMAEIAQLLTD